MPEYIEEIDPLLHLDKTIPFQPAVALSPFVFDRDESGCMQYFDMLRNRGTTHVKVLGQ
jgi:hypothetical protein